MQNVNFYELRVSFHCSDLKLLRFILPNNSISCIMCGINDILSVDDVAAIMPGNITKAWLYSNWEKLGGVSIGRRKLIIRGVLYECLQNRDLVVCQNNNERNQMDSTKSRNESCSLENEARGQVRGGRVKKPNTFTKQPSNRHGLLDTL